MRAIPGCCRPRDICTGGCLARCCGGSMRCRCRAGSTPIAVAKSGVEGGGSERCLRNRLRSNRRDPSDGKNEPSEPPNWLGPTLVIDFVVSMAGEAYDTHEQEATTGNSDYRYCSAT